MSRSVGKDGTIRDTYAQEERATGRTRDELDEAVIPEHCQELFDLFTLLSRTRPQAFAGVSPITPHDISAMTQLLNIKLNPWEVETLLLIDAVARPIIIEQLNEQKTEKA